MSADFDALFDTFTHTAYRLEGLPSYAMPAEDELYQSFLHGTPRPERSVRTSPWMRRIAVTTAGGKRWSRTRVYDTPLTEYQRFEIPAYVEAQTVGDETRLIPRELAGDVGPDFWLFDEGRPGAYAAVLRYSPGGASEGFDVVTDSASLADLSAIRERLHSRATPLPEFVARHNHAKAGSSA